MSSSDATQAFPENAENDPPKESDEKAGTEDAQAIVAGTSSVQVANTLSDAAQQSLVSTQSALSPSPAQISTTESVVPPSGEQIVERPPDPPPRVSSLRNAQNNINDALQQTDQWTEDQKWYARWGFWTSILSIVTGAVVGLGPAAYQWIASAVKNSADPWSVDLSDGQIQALQAVVDAWLSLPDAQLWDQCAAFSDAHHPQVGTQILICQDIVTFSPTVSFTWTETMKADAVAVLAAAYSAAGYAGSAVYHTVKTLATDDGRQLPRGIAANCCALAFATYLVS